MEQLKPANRYSEIKDRVNEMAKRINNLYKVSIVQEEQVLDSKFEYSEERITLVLKEINSELKSQINSIQGAIDDNLSDIADNADSIQANADSIQANADSIADIEDQIPEPGKGFSYQGDFVSQNNGGFTANYSYQIFGKVFPSGVTSFRFDYTVRLFAESSDVSFFNGAVKIKRRGSPVTIAVPMSLNSISGPNPQTLETTGTSGSNGINNYIDFSVDGDALGETLKHSFYVDSNFTVWPAT
tara:strand:- start:983 stop:1711 length:729 start_codon:yes stop_codon:yes gene_type:complete